MCFLPSRSNPEFEIVLLSQLITLYRISQPSPACRVSTDSKCRSTNLKKFSKISRLLPQGREPRGAAPALPLSAMGENSRQRQTPALVPPPQSPSKFTLPERRRRYSPPGWEGGNFSKNYMKVQFRSKLRIKFKVRFSCMSKDLR